MTNNPIIICRILSMTTCGLAIRLLPTKHEFNHGLGAGATMQICLFIRRCCFIKIYDSMSVMFHKFHIPNIVMILVGVLGAVFFMMLFSIIVFNSNDVSRYFNQNTYENDVQILYEIARQLGYEENRKLNFYRPEASFGSSDDVTTLVFSTSDSLEIFSGKVDIMDITRDNSVSNIYGKQFEEPSFVNYINEPYACSLIIADSTSEYCRMAVSNSPIYPLVTKWPFRFTNTSGKELRLAIQYAQLPRKDLFWLDKRSGNKIVGPIVVMDLRR